MLEKLMRKIVNISVVRKINWFLGAGESIRKRCAAATVSHPFWEQIEKGELPWSIVVQSISFNIFFNIFSNNFNFLIYFLIILKDKVYYSVY